MFRNGSANRNGWLSTSEQLALCQRNTQEAGFPFRITQNNESDDLPQFACYDASEAYLCWYHDGKSIQSFNFMELVNFNRNYGVLEGYYNNDPSKPYYEIDPEFLKDWDEYVKGQLIHKAEVGKYHDISEFFNTIQPKMAEGQTSLDMSDYQLVVNGDDSFIVWTQPVPTDKEDEDGNFYLCRELYAIGYCEEEDAEYQTGWSEPIRLTFTDSMVKNFRAVMDGSGTMYAVYNNYNERLTDDDVLIDDMKLAYTVLEPFGSVDVTGISLSNTTPAVGDELKINVAVKNTGLTKADSYTLSLYAVTETDKTKIGTLSGEKLYAGWSQTHEFTWTVPTDFAGVRFVAETIESGYDGQCGSCSSETLEYKPVFEVHNVGAAQEKDGFVVTAQITNQGNAPTLETDKVMLRLCGPYDLAFNIPSEECVLGTTVLPELQPGETQSVSVAVHADADLFERFGYVECLVGVSRDNETLENSTVSKMLYPVSPLLTLLNGEAIPQEITLRKGGSQALSTTYQPVIFNGFTTVSFITDDPSVAKVENGRLKAVSEGTTVLHGLMLQSGLELPDIEITVTDTTSDNTDDNTKDSYAIELSSDIKNGKVEVSPKNAFDGQTVTITVTPDKGYTLETITVLDQNGEEVEVKSLGNNKYSFKMPNGTVSVEVVFAPLQSYATCLGDDTCPISKFTDVNVNAWYHPGVHYCLDNGIMAGFPNDLFKPDGITTRAQIAQILYNLEGQPAFMNDNVFTDVASGSWYDKAVVWAQGKGVVSGYPDGTFKANASINREQLAVILYNYAQYKGIDVSVDENTNFLSFNDFWDVSEWAKPAMMWAIDRELIVGSNWDLKPQGDAVRAQVATIICRFCENVAK